MLQLASLKSALGSQNHSSGILDAASSVSECLGPTGKVKQTERESGSLNRGGGKNRRVSFGTYTNFYYHCQRASFWPHDEMVRMYNMEIYSVLRSQMIWTGWGNVGIRALEVSCQPGLFLKTVFQDLHPY